MASGLAWVSKDCKVVTIVQSEMRPRGGGPRLLIVVKTPMQKQLNCDADVHFDHTLIFLSKAAVMLLSEVRCGHTKES